MSIRVMLADDHRMFREALQESLFGVADIEVVAGAGSGAETLEVAARTRPDVLVLDIAFPDMNGIEVARRLAESHSGIRIVVLSGFVDKAFVEGALKAGVRGYVAKSSGAGELLCAIRAAMAGQCFLSPEVTGILTRQFDHPRPGAPQDSRSGVLSPREREVLRLLCEGRRTRAIAAELHISAATVEVHRRNIKRKLGLKTMAELIRYALQEGLGPV